MVKLAIGKGTQEIVVAADAVQVDTVSTGVSGIVTSQQIDQLAISGRNVMALAQLEPGVQLRDGSDVDPTKNNSKPATNGMVSQCRTLCLAGPQ
jgi:hypothetical protein